METQLDIIIIGAGPAGLSAAINASSEGFRVGIFDSGPEPGGQAAKSSRIENYPGFPEGISGAELIGRFLQQSKKFNATLFCPLVASSLRADGNRRIVTSEYGDTFVSTVVILSAGLSYRTLGAEGIPQLLGRGIQYGAPTSDPMMLNKCTVGVVGGANSAGQAAMHLSRNPNVSVKLLVRKALNDQMSTYLIERITATPNIEVIEGVEVTKAFGDMKLEGIALQSLATAETQQMPMDNLFIFIGAQPKTMWLNGSVHMDPKRFVVTDVGLLEAKMWSLDRHPLGYETSMPGVFACGDVRLDSTKRIASAVGEGAAVMPMCHRYCRDLMASK